MPFYVVKDLPQEVVTPKYSTAQGGVVTGEHIEVGILTYPANTGAVTHQHPHEQFMVVLKGNLWARIGDEEKILEPLDVAYMPSNILHSVKAIDGDVEVLSCKNLVGGVGHKI